jgi:2-(1,2-epoxy-1,2-dihydrophenyl)acetyl-CoA isomerase
VQELVRGVYTALAAGDATALGELLDPGFEAEVAAGMPLGLGGRRRGPEAMIRDTWWPIGRAYSLRVEPAEWIPCEDGRLLVLGHYRGRARASARSVDAAFVHLWTARDGRVVALRHLTDTALWADALEPGGRLSSASPSSADNGLGESPHRARQRPDKS